MSEIEQTLEQMETALASSYESLCQLYADKIIEGYINGTYAKTYADVPALLKPRVAEILTERGYGFLVTV